MIRTLLLAATLAAATAFAANPIDEVSSHDGLAKVTVKGIDLAYARKDTSLAAYKKLIVDKLQSGDEITVEGRCLYRPEEGPKTIVMDECALCEKS